MLELIDDPEYVYMLGIAMLLDTMHRLVRLMEQERCVKLINDRKRVTMVWERFKEVPDALEY